MNAENATVSIVVPCFNQGTFLADCLGSILKQTDPLWKCIVVDDCSTEGDLASVVASFKDSRIAMLRHEKNRGLAAARNTGFRAATTDLVLPVDSDDKLHPRFLEVTSELMKSNPELDCVYTDFQLFGDSDGIWRWSIMTPADMARDQWIPGPGTLMRKHVWERCGGYDESQPLRWGNEDWDFWICAVSVGLKPFHVPEPLYYYRRTHNSMSVSGLLYYDYVTRKRIYQRHKIFFDAHNATRAFLAQGFLRSSCASFNRKKRLRAAWLAFGGLALQPGSRKLHHQFLLSLAPEWARRLLRSLRRRT
jgi:glycosyltransferase involved in cell wall biosynthesis